MPVCSPKQNSACYTKPRSKVMQKDTVCHCERPTDHSDNDEHPLSFVCTAEDTINSYELVGYHATCDVTAGEVAFKDHGKGNSLDQCKKFCATNKECKSFTYFKLNGYCGLFKTICSKTKRKSRAISMRLVIRPPKISNNNG